MELAGAVVVVTGASHGIGRATALALAGRGATVVGVGLDHEALSTVARLTGGSALETDVRDSDHAQRVVEHAQREHGRLDAVVANAGVGYAGSFAGMPVDRLHDLIDVNLRAPMLLAREAVPVLRAHGHGALLFVTSIAGVVPVAQEAAYCASKTALESFADALRMELRATGVAVSTVRPGVVGTAFHDQRDLPYERRWPRLMAPEQVAEVIVETLGSGAAHRTVPRWLGLAGQVRAVAPTLYRRLNGRFG